ncbi:GNAT family N-acetyltransferase [Rhizobium leguminosarum]|uniref:GCN5 family acetyltransferase n=2 Tax=Rhizobium TaxID=379 RepID=A0A179BZ08_RHILE|nr:GNAT family N-acetyltransferase [Rhizobium leguminosarum]MBY5435626.1 GNAT family N-acetyltransferase [Rhizobium leguminosarum]NEI37339.1 GNAT family N-acetyltransferase [Rhizobium leguminosarum]NEI43906.1 GNAT family N-acetyltransferase [Rhizobium leguminosarum]OAP96460.1 GCN5 family acetyltransferase [Rhizobium leguminosarum]
MGLSQIEPLAERHRLESFSCGKPALDAWLATFARSNHQHGFTRVFAIHDDDVVVGYYGLAPTVIAPNVVTRKIRTGRPPDPIPCLLIGQLAVDRRHVGRGIGTALVKDAFRRCIAGADLVGGRAIVVRAVDEEAERFWQSWGFIPSLDNQSILLRSMADIRAWMAAF